MINIEIDFLSSDYDYLLNIYKKNLEIKKIINKNIIITNNEIRKKLNNTHKLNAEVIVNLLKTYCKSLNIYTFFTFMNLLFTDICDKEYLVCIKNDLELLYNEYLKIIKKIPNYIIINNNDKYVNIIINQINSLIEDNV